MTVHSKKLDAFYSEYDQIEEEFQLALDESLHPRGPDALYDVVQALELPPGAAVIDLGCGKGQHAIRLAQQFGFAVLGIDPVPSHLELSRTALEAAAEHDAGLRARVRFDQGTAESIPAADASVDLIWCRESMYHFSLDKAFADCRRVLRDGGRMVIYQLFATDWIEPRESGRLWSSQGVTRVENVQPAYVEAALGRAGFAIEQLIVLSSEQGELAQETAGEPGRRLLHAARLLRDPERYIARFGRPAYDVMLGDCFWHIYRMIGKLSSRIYVLKPV